MRISKLYHIWMIKITQMRPGERKTRVANMAWLIAGIFASKSVRLSQVASKLPGKAMLRNATRRLERFVDNSAIRVREWFEPVARSLLQRMKGHEYRLIVDGSKVRPWHRRMMVSLAYRHRANPLGLDVIAHAPWTQQIDPPVGAALGCTRLGAPRCPVLLVGDQEFGAVEVLPQ